VAHRRRAAALAVAAVACSGAAPVLAAKWTTSANAGATATYTTNVGNAPEGQSSGDFVTSLSAGFNFRGDGARLKIDGSIGATWLLYASQTQNNSIAPSVSLSGTLEAIENFAFVDASANVSTSFLSPFGPQPASLVNATANRYISETYTVSPYIQGVLGPTNISYQVRDDNYWTASRPYGDSAAQVPSTYANNLNASMASGTNPVGWRLEYNRLYYDNGIQTGGGGTRVDPGNYTLETFRAIVSHQVDPQLILSGRAGYERNRFPTTDEQGPIYGFGVQWRPTERTNIGGFWEHQFFGSSYDWQLTHRLPSAAISASFTRGLTSYPQLALAIPAGTTVTQFLDAAFTTRIPDPAERAAAVAAFLARTGLPPTLAAPVNFYATSIQLQNAATVSLVLLGVRNSITFTAFRVESSAISGQGTELPPALQFGQDNTQTGVGFAYSYQFPGGASMTGSYTFTQTTSDNPALTTRSGNGNLGVSLSKQVSPKTTVSGGVAYTTFQPIGTTEAVNSASTSSVNVFVGINHTFW
jgi:uncharacterized protein (PEP-CTERM system associated)